MAMFSHKLKTLSWTLGLGLLSHTLLVGDKPLDVELYRYEGLPKTTEALGADRGTSSKSENTIEEEGIDPRVLAERESQPAAYGPSTKRMAYRVKYPDYEKAMRNIMDPIPLPNNPQIYPFMMTVPFEGADILPPKHLELTFSTVYVKGKTEGRSAQYQIDMDNEYHQQTFGISMGLPGDVEIGISIPLYHFEGDMLLTQNGVSGIGPLGASRNFWGGATLRVKGKILKSHKKDEGSDFLMAGYFQFPEGNQRAQGGTSSGHWAMNAIYEKRWLRQRFHLNLGVTQAGTLRLDNNVDLPQDMGWFLGAGLSHKLNPTSAVEVQLHGDRSALADTNISDFENTQWSLGIGYRKQLKKSLDASLTFLKGIDSPVESGASIDLRYFW